MTRFEDIIEAEQKRLASVLRAAFEAGEQSARHKILSMLSEDATIDSSASTASDEISERKRAPRGLPRKLVKRVLAEREYLGSGPQDIADAAVTEHEKMIALSTIRGELRKGTEAGLYLERDGLFYLDPDAADSVDDQEDNHS